MGYGITIVTLMSMFTGIEQLRKWMIGIESSIYPC